MTKAIFDDAADHYDKWYETPAGRAVDYVERRAFESLFTPSGKKVLEIGCGTGLYTVRLAEKGYDVAALDISPEMMKRAQKKVRDIGKEVKFILGDISELIDSLESYDGIFSMTAFEFVPLPDLILQKLYRKLNPGGCLVIGVIADNSTWSEIYRQSAEKDPNSVFRHARFFTEDEIRSWNIGTEPEIRKVLFFPPGEINFEEALKKEDETQGSPGFLVACWRR